MLIQLSRWEMSPTSIRIPASSRRRKPNANDVEEYKACASFTASMVTTASKRSLSRMKVKAAEFHDCLPFLAITVDHHITVLGKNLTENEGSSSYREFSNLRYNSRPGDAGSFFARPSNRVSPKNKLPDVPAVLDTKNDRVYALQQGNTRLTCWNPWKCSGPDDKLALRIHFEYPALSMKLLPMSKGIVYGSCENGAVYFARVIGDKLSVEYLHVNEPKRNVHIGTFAEIETEEAKTSGRKRKTSDADCTSFVNLYQVFGDGLSIKILRNTISLSTSKSDNLIKSGSLVQQSALIDLLNDDTVDQRSRYSLNRAELLISSTNCVPKINIVYTISKILTVTGHDEFEDPCCGTFCATISLPNGEFSNSPVRLPFKTNQFGLITETVLVAASSEMIYLCDLITGSTLQRNSIKHIRSDTGGDKEWVLHTNDKHGILSILFRKDDYLHVALSTASCDGKTVNLTSSRLKSSSKLASYLFTKIGENFRQKATISDQVNGIIANRDTITSLILIRLDEKIAKALSTLEKTRRAIISEDSELCSEISFREVFDMCLSNLVADVISSKRSNEACFSKYSNPQDSCNTKLKSQTKTVKNEKMNVRFNSLLDVKKNKGQKISTCVPQSFIDESMQIVLSIILESKQDKNSNPAVYQLDLDARHVLRDLIQSKRISARLHFEGSHALHETGKPHPLSLTLKALSDQTIDNPFSSLQIIVELIINCSDLSERHLVVMLDYIMRHMKSHGIVDTVRYHNAGKTAKEHNLVNGYEQKTMLAEMKAVLRMIVGYSQCNEAMLRVALAEELKSSTEALILSRMLPNLLIASPIDNPAKNVRSASQWISALSKSYREDLTLSKTSSGLNHLSTLLNSIEKITKNSQAVMVLKDSIGAAEMINKDKKICIRKSFNEDPGVEEICGYSIDHIIF